VLLLAVITALLRNMVQIPDSKRVPREMYDAKVLECNEWKGIATSSVATVKATADQLQQLTDISERLVRRR